MKILTLPVCQSEVFLTAPIRSRMEEGWCGARQEHQLEAFAAVRPEAVCTYPDRRQRERAQRRWALVKKGYSKAWSVQCSGNDTSTAALLYWAFPASGNLLSTLYGLSPWILSHGSGTVVTLSLQRLSDLSKVMRLKRIRSLESLPSVAISRDPAPPLSSMLSLWRILWALQMEVLVGWWRGRRMENERTSSSELG